MKNEISKTPVKSSSVASIGYDDSTRTLAVVYKHGGEYHYHGVTPEAYVALQKAESVGKHLHSHVIKQHKFTRVQ